MPSVLQEKKPSRQTGIVTGRLGKMPVRSIESLKRLNGRFLAIPREYKYFCRNFAGTPSLPAAILRIYVYETQVNDQYLDLSEVDLCERMDWEWGERRIAAARQFLIRAGLLRQETSGNGHRTRLAVNCELLDKEDSSLPENWEEDLMQRVRPAAHQGRPQPAHKSTGGIREAVQKGTGVKTAPVQKGTGTGAKRNRFTTETGAEMHRSRDVSLSIQNLPEDPPEKLASFPDADAKADEAYVRAEVEKGVAGRMLGGKPADAGTIMNLTKHLVTLRFEDRVLAWHEIYDCYRRSSSWGLPVSIAQRYASGDGRAEEDTAVHLTPENCMATPPRVICGYRDMAAAEEEVLRRKAAMSQVSCQPEAALHG